jgi:hypothetical protein
MPFTLEAFIARRPFLYHFTAVENVDRIRQLRRLDSAAILSQKSEHFDLSKRRKTAEEIGQGFWLQTQRPLYEKNICFVGGWVMADLLARLNTLIFFWPGTGKGPIPYGHRHRAGNKWPSKSAALRVDTRELFESANPAAVLFCPYNSGSPRCVNGRKSPRGPHTFLSVCDFPGTLSKVVEVVAKDTVHLPESTEFGTSDSWKPHSSLIK